MEENQNPFKNMWDNPLSTRLNNFIKEKWDKFSNLFPNSEDINFKKYIR